MSMQILMPALSPTMEEGKLAKWLVKEGDEIHSGDILAEIETDKATMEFEAVDEGRIGRILVPEGTEGVKVNQPIAELVQDGASNAPGVKEPKRLLQKPWRNNGQHGPRAKRASLTRERRSRLRPPSFRLTRISPPAPNSLP